MSERKAVNYFEKHGRRVLVDLSFFDDDLLVEEMRQLAVAHLIGRDGLIAWRSVEGRPHVVRVSDAKKSGDNLVIFGTSGDVDVEMTLTPPLLGPQADKFFKRKGKSEAEHIASLDEQIEGALSDKPEARPRRAKKKYKVTEVGVIDYVTGAFETGGAIAVSGKDVRFVPSLKHRDRLTPHFEEKIQRVGAHMYANPGETSYSKWVDYLIESGGQGELSFSEIEQVTGSTAKEAATKRLVRALRGTQYARA
jgi:hypothetical protein